MVKNIADNVVRLLSIVILDNAVWRCADKTKR